MFRKKNKPRRVIVLALADLHSGNKLGLLSPETVLLEEDGHGSLVEYHPTLSKLQEVLWPLFTGDCDKLKDLAGDDEIIVIVQGDLVQGDKHKGLQVSPGRPSDQNAIAVANLAPILSLPNVKQVRIASGTAAHDGPGADVPAELLRLLQALYPHITFKLRYHGVLNINGLRIDYAHHGPHPGTRRRLKGNAARLYLRDLVEREWQDHMRIHARITTRAHQHAYLNIPYVDSINGVEYEFSLFLIPSWCGIDDFIRKVSKSTISQEFGMIAFEIVDGTLIKAHPLLHEIDLRTEEAL